MGNLLKFALTTRFALSVKLDFMACISELGDFKIVTMPVYLVYIRTADILAVDMRLNASLETDSVCRMTVIQET